MDLLRDMVVDMIDFYYFIIVIYELLFIIIVYQSLGKKEGRYVRTLPSVLLTLQQLLQLNFPSSLPSSLLF